MGSAGVRLLGMLLSFVLGIQLARALGVEEFGIYGIVVSALALLSVLIEFGMPQLLIRETAAAYSNRDWGRIRELIQWSSRISTMFALVALIAVTIWLFLREGTLTSPLGLTLVIGVLMSTLTSQANLRTAVLRGLQFIVLGQASEVLVRPAVFSLFLLVLTLHHGPLSAFEAMAGGAVAALISAVAAGLIVRRNLPVVAHSAPLRTPAKAWTASAVPMALAQGIHVIQGNIMFLMLGAFAQPASVGAFRIATSLLLLIATPLSLLSLVAGPLIARLYSQGRTDSIRHLLAYIAVGMLGGTIVLAVPFLTHGHLIIGALYGPDFAAAALPTMILCVSAIICSALGANIILLTMCGKEGRITRALAITFLPMLLASFPLVYYFQLTGAAIGVTLSTITWNTLLYFDSKRLLGIDPSVLSVIRNPKIFLESHIG